MPNTTGLVQNIVIGGGFACVWIGPTQTSAELFNLAFAAADDPVKTAFKKNMIGLLQWAQLAGMSVEVFHGDNSPIITTVSTVLPDISPAGPAIHGDFFSVAATNIPVDAIVVFTSAAATVNVTPEVVRPHMAFISQLPAAVPLGRNQLHLEGSGWSTGSVPVDVSDGPRLTVRVLYSGAPKTQPYNIVFVANPAIRDQNGAYSADPVLGDRAGFHNSVRYCLGSLFTLDENVLRQNNMDANIRLVTIFDATQGVTDANTLAQGDNPNIMEPRRTFLRGFVSRYQEIPDIVYVIHGSTTYDRAAAWFTTDDPAQPGTAFTYDSTNSMHGHFAQIPGGVALPTDADQTGPTPLHEFGHAASDFDHGRVIDLYVDGAPGGFNINKKWRTNSTDAVPADFATYDGTTFKADSNRDGLGYPPGWKQYQPLLIDGTRPNIMDNYWLTPDHLKCQLDELTRRWFADRLSAKIFR
jgi:hypothetical protein